MPQQDYCDRCTQRHDCKQIYGELGKTVGPSVVLKVIVAFLLPIVVFIAALAIFEKLFAQVFESEKLRVAASVLSSIAAAFSAILLVRFLKLKRGRNR